jgi:hypothetical protein
MDTSLVKTIPLEDLDKRGNDLEDNDSKTKMTKIIRASQNCQEDPPVKNREKKAINT